MDGPGNEIDPDSSLSNPGWQRVAWIAAILVVAIASNDRVREGAIRLHASAFTQLREVAARGTELGTPRAGEGALTEPVLQMVEMLRENGVEQYRISPEIGGTSFVRQRLIEGAWPIRFDPSASLEILYLSESTRCAVVDRREFDADWDIPRRQRPYFRNRRGVRLVRCR